MKSLNPNNFGKKLLAENCPKIVIKDLLAKWKVQFKEQVIKTELEAMGINIELTTSRTNYSGKRYWFKCPICKSRRGVIYKHPLNGKIGCRECLNLDYCKRRFKGMLEEKINK